MNSGPLGLKGSLPLGRVQNPGRLYTRCLDLDFAALPNQAIAGTPVAIGGKAWILENAAAGTANVVNGSGLVIQTVAASKGFGSVAASRTCLNLQLAPAEFLPGGVKLYDLDELWLWGRAHNDHQSDTGGGPMQGPFIALESWPRGIVDQFFAASWMNYWSPANSRGIGYNQGRHTEAEWTAPCESSGNPASTSFVPYAPTHDVVAIVANITTGNVNTYSGVWSGTWPKRRDLRLIGNYPLSGRALGCAGPAGSADRLVQATLGVRHSATAHEATMTGTIKNLRVEVAFR